MNFSSSSFSGVNAGQDHNLDYRQYQYYPYYPQAKPEPKPKAQPKTSAKSQPCDPTELRRRLYLVIAERETLKDRQKRAQHDAEARKAREDKILAAIRPKGKAPNLKSAAASKDGNAQIDLSLLQSQELPPHSESCVAAHGQEARAPEAMQSSTQQPPGYIPQAAATQFRQTTTSDIMFSSSTVAIQRSLSNRENQEGRKDKSKNRYTVPRRGHDTHEGLAGIREHGRRSPMGYSTASNSSEEILAQRLQTAPNDFRVDWSQRDETHVEKRRSSFLRKAESVWGLKGKLGSLAKPGKDTLARTDDDKEPTSPLSSRPRLGFLSKLKH